MFPIVRRAAAAWLLGLSACANVTVPEASLPPRVAGGPFDAGRPVLVRNGAPEAMLEEMEAFVGGPDHAVAAPADGAPLRSLCRDPSQLLLRARHDDTFTASNLGDRNVTIYYYAATVIALPIALFAAAVWPWDMLTVVSGELEVWPCAGGEAKRYADSYRVRSGGRGFVRRSTVTDAQLAGGLRGLSRELLEQAATDLRKEP